MHSQEKEFHGLRAILFPIHWQELKKFLLLSLMQCFIIFTYQLLWDAKYTLIVHSAGAEALSLVKLLGVIPGAIITMLVYTKLSNIFSREKLFYISIVPFLLFFGLFAFVLYPNQDLFHPSEEWVQQMALLYPRLRTFFELIGHWSYGLFYVASELWGSVAISLLFWQLANDLVSMKEAKRFYPLFGLITNLSLIFAGITIGIFSEVRDSISPDVDPWEITLKYLIIVVLLCGIAILFLRRWIATRIAAAGSDSKKPSKSNMSLKDSFLHLSRSKYLLFLTIMVMGYGISQNMIEGVWQDQVKTFFNNQNSYSAFMGHLSLMIGLTTFFFILLGSNILRLSGWYLSAVLTPIIILSTGLFFFFLVIFKEQLAPYTTAFFDMTPLALAVWIGFFQDVLTKSSKYSLFDPTKEMCYIPLDQESKVKGKAAIDVVGARFGKCGGAFVQQTLLFLTASTLASIAPYLAVMCILTVAVWIFAVGRLHENMQELHEEAAAPSTNTTAISTS